MTRLERPTAGRLGVRRVMHLQYSAALPGGRAAARLCVVVQVGNHAADR